MGPLENRHVGTLVEDLYEDLDLWYPTIRLREAGAAVTLLGTGRSDYRGKHGLPATADVSVDDIRAETLDALVIPGGYAPDHLRRHAGVLALVREMDRQQKPVAFICHAGWVPISAGIVRGRRVTSFHSIRDDLENAGARWEDSPVVVDGHLISSRHPGDLPVFCRTLIAELSGVA
ncbi:intracellular protease, PfpI family [Thioflavicoccus mobilis 8321]|uniref:Intracellular protease, PfpI family n=1 Tax=Thioflavicoccus mobilis 8321 TaxID=765912 RepID=L0GZ93_9GAMM|nr:type 1 glutamine amidotransferase domain-containing protein [Thioflavicoccus mobilis]AGA90629.1 intracellular protease, PfpI family [Thioflavicoccus mobilis 8321]